MIIIDDGNIAGYDLFVLVSKNPACLADEKAGASPEDFFGARIGGRLALGGNGSGIDWDIRNWVQYRVRIKFLKSTIACGDVFSAEWRRLPRRDSC